MKLILQGFYANSTQNATFNDFNEFTTVSKLFNPFMTVMVKYSLAYVTQVEHIA